MHDFGEGGGGERSGMPNPERPPFASMRRRRSARRNNAIRIGIVIGLFLLAGGIAWYLLRSPDPAPPVADAPAGDRAPMVPMAPPPDADPEPEVPPLDLPELGASDAFVRELVTRLSGHPQLAAWLVTDELVQRFVGAVVSLAGGSSPAEHVEFLVPEEEFQVRESGGRLVVDPSTYRRYDLLVETFTTVDTEGTAQLYHQLHPLFEEVYAELGIPDQTFDDAMERAVANLLAAEVVDSPFEVEPVEAIYQFGDPAMEERTAAEKHLLRMGEENALRVQTKLRELAEAIGISNLDTL